MRLPRRSAPPRRNPPRHATGLSDVHTDEAKVQALSSTTIRSSAPAPRRWRQAAQAHYDVIQQLRKEQQRLITEADMIQRTIDELEKKYTDLTTPAPALEPPENTPQSPAQPGAPAEPGR